MRVTFYASDKPREVLISRAMGKGVRRHGDEFEVRRTQDYGEDEFENDLRFPGPTPDTDVAMTFGVKGKSRQVVNDHVAVGKACIYIDKGYTRQKGDFQHTLYSRMSVNSNSPHAYMMLKNWPDDRWKKLQIELKPKVELRDRHAIYYCGSSQKYHEYNNLPNAEEFAARILGKLRRLTKDYKIVYRPKPSYLVGGPIKDFGFSGKTEKMGTIIAEKAFLIVTHGATSAMEAVIGGVPAICMGECVATPVTRSDVASEPVNNPWFPGDKLRRQWANAMAYTQFTMDEMESGLAWELLKAEVERQKK